MFVLREFGRIITCVTVILTKIIFKVLTKLRSRCDLVKLIVISNIYLTSLNFLKRT